MKGVVLNKLYHLYSFLVETDEVIKMKPNRCFLLKTKKKIIINPDVDNENIILLEDISPFYDPYPERQRTDRELEAQHTHHRTGSVRQDIMT